MKSEEFNGAFAERLKFTPEETQKKTEELIAFLTDKLVQVKSVTVRDVGEFSILSKKERIISMPEVKKERVMPAKPMVIFRCGERLKDIFQKLKLEDKAK